jgi:hypothetical protein
MVYLEKSGLGVEWVSHRERRAVVSGRWERRERLTSWGSTEGRLSRGPG